MRTMTTFCAIVIAMTAWVAFIGGWTEVGTRDTHVRLEDGRVVECIQTRGISKAISCDWQNARKP